MNYPAPGYPQQYPPQQQIPQPPMQPQYPGYPQQAPGFPPQQFQPPAYQPPQQPSAPLATGTLDDFYNQPSAGGGPSISWKDKPIGSWYAGVVARDVTHADVQQQTDPQTKQPKFYRDGRPQFVMKVPLIVERSEQFPEGEATLFVRGQMRDELVRAMGEVGAQGSPKQGATIVVQLAGKRNTGAIPANQFAIKYQPPAGAVAASPAPAPEAPAQQVEQPQQVAQPLPIQQPPTQFPPQVATVQVGGQGGGGYAQPQFQPPVQQQVPAQPAAPQAPADFNAEQQALLARLTGQQAQPVG